MASQTPIMPFLRPLRVPRRATMLHFLRFSTTTRCKQIAASSQPRPKEPPREDPNLTASRTAPPTYPPPSMKSLPRPKKSKAIGSRRTAHPPKQRPYPTRQPSHSRPPTPKLIPEPVTTLPAEQCAPNLAYFVTRTRSNELPVYQMNKRGGSLKLTRVRKIDGDPGVLRDELREVLVKQGLGVKRGVKKEDCVVNPVTKQVVVKGHWKGVVEKFLRERMF